MRKIVWTLIFLLVLVGGYIFRNKISEIVEKFYFSLNLKLPEIQFKIPEIKNLIEKPQVLTPPPLKIQKEGEGFLTKEGVIYWTNVQRKNYGLLPLKENEFLNQSAELKLNDMFKKQYFAHTSPEGIELKDLVKKVGYEFILIGENLAMGNFKNDENLVLAWMESEGHRENILNEKYQEIGVAVGQGIFEGKKVWIAVQHFGKPISACPQPNENLKMAIEENKKKLESLEKILNELRNEIEREKPKWQKDSKEKIEKYNNLVEEYNLILKQTQRLIFQYNNQVQLFNECASQ